MCDSQGSPESAQLSSRALSPKMQTVLQRSRVCSETKRGCDSGPRVQYDSLVGCSFKKGEREMQLLDQHFNHAS